MTDAFLHELASNFPCDEVKTTDRKQFALT